MVGMHSALTSTGVQGCALLCNRVKHIVMMLAERADLPIEIVGSCLWHGHSFDFIITFLSFREIKIKVSIYIWTPQIL